MLLWVVDTRRETKNFCLIRKLRNELNFEDKIRHLLDTAEDVENLINKIDP